MRRSQSAQPTLALAALDRLFRSRRLNRTWFSERFLAEYPLAHVRRAIRSLIDHLGPYERVEPTGGAFSVVLAGGSVPARATIDPESRRVMRLFFGTPIPRSATVDDSIQQFLELRGSVALVVIDNGAVRTAVNADDVMAVGSLFKVAVLSALKNEIQSGKHSWSDVVALDPEWKTLAAGVLHKWPDFAPLTLHTLAALMISESDNTATDALISVIGRNTVGAAGPRNIPFLTTREAYVLKDPANVDLLNRYAVADSAKRLAVLKQTRRRRLPNLDAFAARPTSFAIEWLFTARELSELIESVSDLPLMAINPGPVDTDKWESVAFKAGSDRGVASMAVHLKARDGHRYCIVAVQNDAQGVAEQRFIQLCVAILDALAADARQRTRGVRRQRSHHC